MIHSIPVSSFPSSFSFPISFFSAHSLRTVHSLALSWLISGLSSLFKFPSFSPNPTWATIGRGHSSPRSHFVYDIFVHNSTFYWDRLLRTRFRIFFSKYLSINQKLEISGWTDLHLDTLFRIRLPDSVCRLVWSRLPALSRLVGRSRLPLLTMLLVCHQATSRHRLKLLLIVPTILMYTQEEWREAQRLCRYSFVLIVIALLLQLRRNNDETGVGTLKLSDEMKWENSSPNNIHKFRWEIF